MANADRKPRRRDEPPIAHTAPSCGLPNYGRDLCRIAPFLSEVTSSITLFADFAVNTALVYAEKPLRTHAVASHWALLQAMNST